MARNSSASEAGARRRRKPIAWILLCAASLLTCSNSGTPLPYRADYFSAAISSEAQFDAMSVKGDGVIKTDAVKFFIDNRGTKPKTYFMNERFGAPNPPAYVKYHYDFALFHLGVRESNDSFNTTTYLTNDLKKKRYIAGTVQKYETGAGAGKRSFYGIQFYPQDQIAEESILFALTEVKKVFQVPGVPLAYVSFGSQQTVRNVRPQIEQLSLAMYSISEIYGNIPFIAMNRGEAWGYLRAWPQADNLNRNDIPIFKELPLDLSVVAGTITTVVQDAGSHINLKSRERGTPNMVLRDEKQVEEIIRRYEGRPVHLVVNRSDFVITDRIQDARGERVITDRDIEEHFLKGRERRPWRELKLSDSRDLKSFDEMASVSKTMLTLRNLPIYGGKAMELGLIAHTQMAGEGSALQKQLQAELQKDLGPAARYRITPMGFGAPTAYYFDFVNHPENAALKAKLQTLIDSEMGKNGRQPMEQPARLKLISEIQTMFLEASVPAELASKLETKIEQFKRDFARAYPKSPLKKIKVRSSSNAEDIESFDGAGLHESYSAKLKDGVGNPKERCRVVEGAKGVETKREVQPETLMCAVKAVYASLWTRRAIDERSFARINHATAAMGLAINQKYDFRGDTEGVREVANAVLMTRMIAADGVYGYQLSLNTPDNLVTNPTPGTQSEIVLASFFADKKTEFTVTQYAITELGKPVDTTQIVDRAIYERMVRIAKAVEIGYCKANPRFYGGDCTNLLSDREKPKWMAMEFKIFSNGEVLLKQAREVGGVEKR